MYMKESADPFSPNIIAEWEHGASQWPIPVLVIGIAWVTVVGLFWPTVHSMIAAWNSSRTFAHGFLVVPAAGYLIWCYRARVMVLVPAPSAWGIGAVSMAGMGWFIGYRTNLLVAQQAAVVASLIMLVWALLGAEIFRVLSWPLGFLVFMLPVGTSIEPWLQNFTAWFILIALNLTGIPFLYEEYRITIPSGTWDVAPDCGGLRYLLPGLALGYAFATLIYRQPARRLVFLVVCAAALMIANGIRAYGVIVGDHFGIAEGADHRLFSYTIFGLTIPLVFWLGVKWTEKKTVASSGDQGADVRQGHDIGKIVLTAIAAVALLAVAPLSVWLTAHTP
jgi:exosortase A